MKPNRDALQPTLTQSGVCHVIPSPRSNSPQSTSSCASGACSACALGQGSQRCAHQAWLSLSPLLPSQIQKHSSSWRLCRGSFRKCQAQIAVKLFVGHLQQKNPCHLDAALEADLNWAAGSFGIPETAQSQKLSMVAPEGFSSGLLY